MSIGFMSQIDNFMSHIVLTIEEDDIIITISMQKMGTPTPKKDKYRLELMI